MTVSAYIKSIDFPMTLKPGDTITGTVNIDTVGDERGRVGVRLTSMWDGKEYPLVSCGPEYPGNHPLFYYFPSAGIIAPQAESAEMMIEARLKPEGGTEYRVDQVGYWTISLTDAGGPPVTPPPAGLGGLGLLILLWLILESS